MRVNIYIYIRVFMYIYKYMYVYVYVCVYTYTSIYPYIYTHTRIFTCTNIDQRTRVGGTSSSAATLVSAAATRKERSNVRVGKISAPYVSAPSRKTQNSTRRRGAEGNTRGRGGFEKCPATFTNAYTSADACVCIHTCMHPRSWESRICKDGCLVSIFFHFCEV